MESARFGRLAKRARGRLLEADPAEMLGLPRISSLTLGAAALGDGRTVRLLPPLVTLAVPGFRLHGASVLLLPVHPGNWESSPLCGKPPRLSTRTCRESPDRHGRRETSFHSGWGTNQDGPPLTWSEPFPRRSVRWDRLNSWKWAVHFHRRRPVRPRPAKEPEQGSPVRSAWRPTPAWPSCRRIPGAPGSCRTRSG